MAGKKTWTSGEAKLGYSTRKAPEYVSAVCTSEHEGGAKQSVKGKKGKRTPEATQASGRKQ
jgi:hypothetical protein